MRRPVVCDHGDFGRQRVFVAVERLDRLAVARHAHGRVADELAGVEHMQRPAQIVGHQVGDIDQGRDRPQPDRAQAPLHPVRARPVLHTAEEAADHEGAGVAQTGRQIAPPDQRAVEPPGHGRGVERLQPANSRSGQIPRDAVDAQRVLPVRRDGDFDDRIVQAEPVGKGLPDRRVVRQVDDALMLVGQAHLPLRAQHAVGILAADHALLQVQPGAGNMGAGRGEHALHAGACVGRAAHHLDLRLAGVDDADAQAVGVRMLPRLHDPGDAERRESGGLVLDALDLKADGGQLRGDCVQRRIRLQMLLQPGQGEFHVGSSVAVTQQRWGDYPATRHSPATGGRAALGTDWGDDASDAGEGYMPALSGNGFETVEAQGGFVEGQCRVRAQIAVESHDDWVGEVAASPEPLRRVGDKGRFLED